MKRTLQSVGAGGSESVSETVGVIGLGLMGMALVERFHGGGLDVCGYDVDPRRNDLLARFGGRPAANTGDVVCACSRIVLSLPDSDVVEAVLADAGPSLVTGRIVIDTSTGDPERA